jgi:hypothetical protein
VVVPGSGDSDGVTGPVEAVDVASVTLSSCARTSGAARKR